MGVAGAAGVGDRYDGVFRLLHWTLVVLVLVQFATKLIPVGGFAWATEDRLNAWHLSVGPTIWALMLLRLFWRLTHRVPPPPADLPPALQWFARATHWTFYALLIVFPVLGWISASAYGARPYLLGLLPLPALVGKNEAFAERVGAVHGALGWALLVVIGLHVSGALFHLVVKRDGVMRRMLPG